MYLATAYVGYTCQVQLYFRLQNIILHTPFLGIFPLNVDLGA